MDLRVAEGAPPVQETCESHPGEANLAGTVLPGAAGGEPEVPGSRDTAALERTLRALLIGSGHLVALVEADGTIAYVSRSVTPLLGHRPEEMVGRSVAAFIHPEDIETALSVISVEVDRPRTGSQPAPDADIAGEYRIRHVDGHWVPFEFARTNCLANPDIAGLLIIGRPIVARHALEQALGVLAFDSEGTESLRYLLDYLEVRMPGTVSSVLVTAERREWIGGAATEGLRSWEGPWEEAVASSRMVTAAVGDDPAMDPLLSRAAAAAGFKACWCLPLPVREPKLYTYQRASTRRDDETLGCLVVWSEGEAELPPGYLGVLERISGLVHIALEHRVEQHRLRRLVDYDQVTGALTRVGMRSILESRPKSPTVHLLFDLDDFKEVNDRYGHAVGDEVLRLSVGRIMSVLRHGDLLVRMGGDEFLVLLGAADVESGVAVSRRLIEVLSAPIGVGSDQITVRTSIGIAAFDAHSTVDELIDRADRAMYAAKQAGKGRWHVWSPLESEGRPA
jgi:diguanylate cyclase (GGDEF)-like protein/PAS domain S-box-containing protein